jgi:hypothetical protein
MKHGTYIGIDPALKGETALLRRDGDSDITVLAQFDNMELVTHPGECLYSGWHQFLSSDFKEDMSTEEQQDALQNAIELLVEASVDLAVYRESDATSPYGFICHENAVTAAERKLEDLMIDIFGDDDEVQP